MTVDISISRKLPVINGFVAIPDGQQFLRTKLTPLDVLNFIPGSTLMRMGARTNMITIQTLDPTSMNLGGYNRLRERLYIQLPEHDRLQGPPADWFAELRDVANAI